MSAPQKERGHIVAPKHQRIKYAAAITKGYICLKLVLTAGYVAKKSIVSCKTGDDIGFQDCSGSVSITRSALAAPQLLFVLEKNTVKLLIWAQRMTVMNI